MSGRNTQLGRQLRKLRHLAAGSPADRATTLRRATSLAGDLAIEHATSDEVPAALRELVERAVIDAALADRLAGYAADVAATSASAQPLAVGADLDRFLRSLEQGALAPALPFEALVDLDRPRPDSASAVTIAGRVLALEVTHGAASILLDDQPLPTTGPLALGQAPTSKPAVQHQPGGEIRVVWSAESLVIEIAADFAEARIADR